MNDKMDDSEGKSDHLDDTASLLESLFKDTKSSQIKVVKRRMRPKSAVKKRVISKRRRDEGEETSQTPAQKRRRPSPSAKSTRTTESNILSRKASLPASNVPKGSKTEQNRQRLRRKSTAGVKPTPESANGSGKRISRPGGPRKEKPSSKTIAGPGEERTESLDQSVLNSMISMASGIKGSRKRPRHDLTPEKSQLIKPKKGGGEKTPKANDVRTKPPVEIEGITGKDDEITEVLEKFTLDSMISEINGSREEGNRKASAKESPVPGEEVTGATIFFDDDDVRKETSPDIEGSAGKDGEITDVLEKSVLNSMISEIEESGKEGDLEAPTEESPVSDEEDTGAEIFFDSDDLREETSPDVEGIAGKDGEITDVLEKSVLNSMISVLEGRGQEGRDRPRAEKSSGAEEEETGVGIVVDSDDLKEEASAGIEETTGVDDEITEILEKTALDSMISELEGSGEEGQDQPRAEKSSVSEEEEVGAGIAIDGDDLKEEASADIEEIDGATEEDSLSQEKPAAPSSITIEDSLHEASGFEAYPEPTLEEESISEERKEGVEEAPQAVDLKAEKPSDSENAELIKEKTLSQEEPAVSTSIPYKVLSTKADRLEVHHILEEKEKSILEDKKEGIEETSDAVGLEAEPLSDSSGPTKEEPRFPEMPVPNLMSSEDSTAYTGEEKHHHKPAAEEEPMSKGEEDDFEEVYEPAKSKEEEPEDLEEGIALTEAEFQLIKRSKRRSNVIRVGLPLVLFGVLAVILSVRYLPLDFFRPEQKRKSAGDETVEISSSKKQGITPKTLRKTAPTARQGVQPSTPTPAKGEIVRAPVPRRRDAAPETQKEAVAAVTPEVKPSTSEPPTILAMKESIEESSPVEQNTTPETSKETLAATEQEVRPQPPGPATSPPPSDAAAKAEPNQKETSKAYPYTVYLGSYRTPEGVEKALSVYNENGLSSLYWQEVDLGDKGIWYRVFAGRFKTKGEAEEYIEDQQLADAKVQKTEQGATVESISVKDVVPQAEASKEQRLLPEATAGSSYPFSVYIGSYKNLDRARKAASDYQTKGASYWVKTDLGDKGVWYRVYAGCFQTRDQAESFIKTHQIADGESRRTTYANLIGTYSSDEGLEEMRLSLLNLEFGPYVIEASGGGSHLFTGAFYQKARAEKEHLDLKAKGIQSQVVER